MDGGIRSENEIDLCQFKEGFDTWHQLGVGSEGVHVGVISRLARPRERPDFVYDQGGDYVFRLPPFLC